MTEREVTETEKKEHRFAEIFRLQQLPLKMTLEGKDDGGEDYGGGGSRRK